MLTAYPPVSEFEINAFQRGFVEAMRHVERIAQEAESFGATDEQIANKVQDYVQSSIHRYEPGHDKPANSF